MSVASVCVCVERVFPCALTVRYCLLSHSGSGCKSVVVWSRGGAAVVPQVKRKERKKEKERRGER